MLRTGTFFGRSAVLTPRQFISAQFLRNIQSSRILRMPEGCDQEHCPPPECPPKKRCLMDLYPIPSGSWQKQYDANNAIYHRQLMVAAGVLIVTWTALYNTGWVKGYKEVTLF